jgi:spermidine synthase
MDGRRYLSRAVEDYDVIFVGIIDPSSLQANRYFTREFFELARERLRPGGMLVFGVTASLTYGNDELKDLNSCIYHTLASVFRYIRALPGDGRNLFMASDSDEVETINEETILDRLLERDIAEDAGLPWHIERKLHQGWSDWFRSFIEGYSREVNRDFRPMGMYYSIALWNSIHQPGFGRLFRTFERIQLSHAAIAAAALLAAFLLFRTLRKGRTRVGIPFSIMTTGIAGMMYGLLIIFAFQVVYGYVFAWIGLLVALYMAGAACGALFAASLMKRISNTVTLFRLAEVTLILYSLVLPFVIFTDTVYSDHQSAFLNSMVFLLLSGFSGLLTGAQFPLANTIQLEGDDTVGDTGGLLYACDLAGGWLGGMCAAVVFLPVLGFTGTCLLVAMLKFTSFVILSIETTWMYKEV